MSEVETTVEEAKGAETEEVTLGPGANEEAAAKLAAASSINLDTKVTSNGKSYSVAELLEKAQRAEEAEEIQSKANELNGALRVLYGTEGELDPAVAEPHLRKLLLASGLEGQALEAKVAEYLGTQEAEEVEEEKETETKPAPALSKSQELELKLARGRLEEDLKMKSRATISQDESVKAIMAFRKESGASEEELEKLLDWFTEETYTGAVRAIQRKINETGTLEYAQIQEAITPSCATVVAKARNLFGDPKGLGRSNLDASGEALLNLLESKPKPAPVFKPGETKDLAGEFTDHTIDALTRVAAQIQVGGDGGKV